MLLTRNSKRLAQKQNTDSTVKSKLLTKCEGTSLNQDVVESKRNLNRACKQILQGKMLREKDKNCKENNANKKLLAKGTLSVKLTDKLQNNESKKIKKALNLKKNIKNDKENNVSRNRMPLRVQSKDIDKAKSSSKRKITNYFPLKSISDNAVCRVPVWAASKNLPRKQAKKRFRVSDIYNIEKDEDLMNESPIKMKKMMDVKKPRTIKNKIFSKKNIPSHNSHKGKFLSVKAAKPLEQLTKCKGLTENSNKTEGIQTKPICHPVEEYGTSRSISILEPRVHVPEPVDSVFEPVSFHALKGSEMPVVRNENVTENNVQNRVKRGGYVDCINNCYSSFTNIDTSYISLRHSVAKCLSESAKDNMTPEKHSTQGQNKTNSYIEDCINECYSSFINLDTSLHESTGKNMANLTREDKTPEKSPGIQKSSSEVKTSNSHDIQLFLIPKMTSTPENGDHPIIQPIKQLSKNCGLKSEMSAIPCSVSRNIQFELSEYEISPIKPALDNQKTSFKPPSKENNNPKDKICLSRNTKGTNNLKEIATMKVREKNPTIHHSKIPKISEKNCAKSKNNREDTDTLLQKENIEKDILPRLRHKRKGPMSPLKPIQVDSVNNKIPFNGAENQVLPFRKDNKNLGKTCPKHKSKKVATNSVDNVTDSSSKNSAEKDDFHIDRFGLFESPEKEKKAIEKSPVKNMKNIFAEKTPLFTKDDDLIKVMKPVNCYQSPHQLKAYKSRTKAAPERHGGKTKYDKETDLQPKKPARTKKVREEKQKEREENEEAENMDEIEKLNQHFSDLEKMDLCIE